MLIDVVVFVLLMLLSFVMGMFPILGIGWYAYLGIGYFGWLDSFGFWTFFIASALGTFAGNLIKVRESEKNTIAEITVLLVCGYFSVITLDAIEILRMMIATIVVVTTISGFKVIRRKLEGKCLNIAGMDFCVSGSKK